MPDLFDCDISWAALSKTPLLAHLELRRSMPLVLETCFPLEDVFSPRDFSTTPFSEEVKEVVGMTCGAIVDTKAVFAKLE